MFDNNVAPQSAQIVVFAFDIKDVTDSTYAKRLLENAAHFLTVPEPAPNGTITGRVAVGPTWAARHHGDAHAGRRDGEHRRAMAKAHVRTCTRRVLGERDVRRYSHAAQRDAGSRRWRTSCT